MNEALALAVAATVGGVAAVERKAWLQAQFSRPLVVCTLIGWALGDPLGGLWVGAPLELLWIGAANLGAALPPHETSAAAAIAAAVVAGGSDLAVASLAFLLLAPISLVGRRLEAVAERANDRLVAEASAALSAGLPEHALRMHLASLWRPFVATALLVAVAALFGPWLTTQAHRLPSLVQLGLSFGWWLIWAAGGAMAVRSARLPNGWTWAGAGAVAALLLWLVIGGVLG